MVNLDWYDGRKYYQYETILAVCCFKIKIPVENYTDIELVFKDKNSSNISFDNLFYRFKCSIESSEFPGYYYVPYYTEFLIDKDGNTISLRYLKSHNVFKLKKWTASKPIPAKKIKGGYMCGRGRRDFDEVNGSSRHRFIALAFISYDSDPIGLVVNHKNGIPGDDRITNLEWVSYSENTKHAYQNNLHPTKIVPVVVLDENTGIEKRYRTIADCSNELGFTPGFITARAKKANVRYTDGIRVKFDDGLPWPGVDTIRSSTVVRTVLTKNFFTGEMYIFENVAKASEKTGINSTTISAQCKTKPSAPVRGFSFRFADDDVKWPHESEYHLRMYRRFQNKVAPFGLFLLDSKDNIKAFYECFSDFSKESGLPETTVISRVKNNIPWNGFRLRKFDIKGTL